MVIDLDAIEDPAVRDRVKIFAAMEKNLLIYSGLETVTELIERDLRSVRFIGTPASIEQFSQWARAGGLEVLAQEPDSRLLLQIVTGLGVPQAIAASGLEALSRALTPLAEAA